MTIGSYIFITTLFVALVIIGFVMDAAKSKDKGWEPAYKIFSVPAVRAWHLFWFPLTFLYNKWRIK